MQHPTASQTDTQPSPLVCTVQPHVNGGWSSTVHPVGTPTPTPTSYAVTFPTVADAVRWSRYHYGDLHIDVLPLGEPAA